MWTDELLRSEGEGGDRALQKSMEFDQHYQETAG